ncbi:zinc finger CCHC domain-containing protein 7-like [Centruroides vittatus]|uniref:zinc finger CCHC domain-containing protein 7-like n=1 Tax=Centruroides vittatus TaxID=120091 RepID=UPI003510537F
MWRYPYRIESMGRQFSFHEEASLVYYNPGILVHVDDNLYQRNAINFANYRQYAYPGAYKRYPDYYYSGVREQRRFYPNPYLPNHLTPDDFEDDQPPRKRLKIENGSNIYNNDLNYITNKHKIYDQEQQSNETVIQNPQFAKQTLDPLKLSEQLQKHFGKPSSFSHSTVNSFDETNLNHSVTENHNSGLLVEQMKEIYDTLIAKDDPKNSDELWPINEKDSNFTSRSSGGTCRNCMKIGHSVKNCKNPRKIPLCFICGSDKHEGEVCKEIRCSRCLRLGHYPEHCNWYEREWNICNLCKIPGHFFEECPDIWRRYHLTTSTGDIVSQSSQLPNPYKFCYNCAEEGHFGHECHENRLDKYSYPSNPFIISYGIQKETNNSVKTEVKKIEKEKSEEPEETIKKRFNVFKELWSKQ